jgi:hypothetical protein
LSLQFIDPRLFLRIELPLPQIPGFTANDILTVPFDTRATLLAMLCPLLAVARQARVVKATVAAFTSWVLVEVFIC